MKHRDNTQRQANIIINIDLFPAWVVNDRTCAATVVFATTATTNNNHGCTALHSCCGATSYLIYRKGIILAAGTLIAVAHEAFLEVCLLYTSPSPRDRG